MIRVVVKIEQTTYAQQYLIFFNFDYLNVNYVKVRFTSTWHEGRNNNNSTLISESFV